MSDWTAVLSRARTDDAPVRAFEADLVRRLVGDLRLTVIDAPHVYDLTPDAAAFRAVADVTGPIVVLGWLYPRALFWTLAALGLDGARADGDGETAGRPILPIDLRGACCADAIIDRVKALVPPAEGAEGRVMRFDGPADERWYPVLDYSRCVNCLECLEFCLFGVFETDDADRPVATDPDRCKPGCPACSRVCPEAAIMFPHHPSTPAIAGADEGRIEPLSAETVQADGITKECLETAADQFAARGVPCACERARACACTDDADCGPDCDCHAADPLDRAIDALDSSET